VRSLIVGRRQGSTISVILLESVGTIGQTGNIVDVKRGYARNFLVPRKLAAYATTENKSKFSNIIQNGSTKASAASA
jgi:ribosomal protein L9